MYLLENNLTPELVNFLKENKIISQNEMVISVEKPGEGNMNLVLRIITDQRSFIIKQSRDFVQKYPQIPAPIDRLLIETKFYETISKNAHLSNQMPKLLTVLPEHYVLTMEDLGENSDYSSIYETNSEISSKEISIIISYLNELHALNCENYPLNDELKALNHFHIYKFPFDTGNDFDLDIVQPGLQIIGNKYKSDDDLNKKINVLGEIYLAKGETLIHGDFYPGSFLKTNAGIKIIDPEFGYLGKAEFDLGVIIAHLFMARKAELVKVVFDNYKNNINKNLAQAFAGVEIMRRILGVAQLPLSLSITEKHELLEKSKTFILNYEA